MREYYVANERFPPGTDVIVRSFDHVGDYHVCRDWPEHVPELFRQAHCIHIAGYDDNGVLGELWTTPESLIAK